MSHLNNDQQATKRSKLSRPKKQGKKDTGHATLKPLFVAADLNETCDFKEPMTFKKTSDGANTEDVFCRDVHGLNPVEVTEAVLCQVCNKDIGHMNSIRRTQHVNRCIDKIEEKQREEKRQVKQTSQTNKSPIPDCPMCRRSFKSANARQAHLKKCAVISNVSTEEMLKLVRNQEQEAESKLINSFGQSNKSSKPTKVGPSRKRKIKEPKSQFDEDVQLALAVSSSLVVQNKSEADILEDNLIGMTGQNKRRKKKQIMEDVCLLTTLSNEDRQRRVEQKLNSLLVDELSESDGDDDIPPLQGSSLGQSNPQTKLWQISNHDKSADILAFYVSALMPPIVTSRLKTGSKLKRLSSIPGRDKTFLEPSANKSVLSPGAVEDVFTASTQTAVVLAELAIDDNVTNNVTMLDQSSSGDIVASPNASGFCEETLGLKEEILSQSRLEAVNSFRSLINCPEFSDMSIKTADKDTVYGHRAFLLTRFPSLKKLFQASDSSILLPLSKEACLIFMEYVYTGALSCSPSVQNELVEMAEKLAIPLLKETCCTLTSFEKQDTEISEIENKSFEDTAHLHPVMNMKDIWGESDSEVEDVQDARREGTDTECETDKQEPICDEDYNDIKCTQRKHISHEAKLPTWIENVDSNDSVCQKASEIRFPQRIQISNEVKLPSVIDKLDNNVLFYQDSTMSCTQRQHISDDKENYSVMEELIKKEPNCEHDYDIQSSHTKIGSHERESSAVIEKINKKESVNDKDSYSRCTQRSSTSKEERIPAVIDVSDDENSISSESDIMLLGNLCANKSESGRMKDISSTSRHPVKETNFSGDNIPSFSDWTKSVHNSSEDDCNEYMENYSVTGPQSCQQSQDDGKLSTLQSICNSPVNILNAEDNDCQEKKDTSMVDLFESPLFNGSYIQPKSYEYSPTSSNSPLFNRKRKNTSDSPSRVVQLELETVDDVDTKLNSSQRVEGGNSNVLKFSSYYKDQSTESGYSIKVETNDSFIKDDVKNGFNPNTSERKGDKLKTLSEGFTGTELDEPKQSKYLRHNLSLNESDILPDINSDLQGDNHNSSETEVNFQNTHIEHDKHILLNSSDKRDNSPDYKNGDELGEEVDLISCDSDVEGQLQGQRDITSEDCDKDCDDKENLSQHDGSAECQDILGLEQNIEDQEDVWEDFDDYGMGYTDLPSPVRSHNSGSDHDENTEAAIKDVTLTEDLSKGDTLNTSDEPVNVELNDKDDSFVFNVSENRPLSKKCQSSSFKTPTVNNKPKEKKAWVPPSPFTPMPDYDSMNTPLLKKEVKKYGVRPVSKKRMVTVLKDIYQKTHQYETDSEFEDEIDMDSKNTNPEPVQSPSKDNDVLSQDSITSSQESDTTDNDVVMEESILLEGSTSESDTQSSPQKGVDVKKKMLNYILSNQDLHMRVMMYEPLEIDVLKADMKEVGIKCSMDKLLEFLDEKCIAFTSKNTRKRAQTKRGKKKASPKKQKKINVTQNGS